jgi:hypothetical protein
LPSPTATPAPSATATSSIYTGIFAELLFTDTSWVQVATDGVRQFQGELSAGTYRSWYAEERLELRIGNAGAVNVTINGQNQGTLGAPGEVIDRVFEIVDEQVAATTPTSAPTLGPVELTATAASTVVLLTPTPTGLPTIAPTTSTAITPTITPQATETP